MRYAFVVALLVTLTSSAFAQDAPIPPKDAEWTIYCAPITGPDRVRQSKQLRVDLVRKTGMRDWYLLQGENETTLYYGFYRTIEATVDKKESARAKNDLHKIQEIVGSDGEHPFARAGIVEIVPPDPDGPPAWNLANLNRGKAPDDPTRAYFTLQIAAYKDSPERKKAAVDAVREFRKRGVEAYYHHGQTISEVCVGAWPRSAVKEQEAAEGGANPDEAVIVSNTPLSPQTIQELKGSDGGRASKVVEPKFEPLDPTLIKTMQTYPNLYINGEVMGKKRTDPSNGQTTVVPDPSFIVLVPEPDTSLIDAPPVPNVAPPPAALAQPNAPAGAGKLKSLDE